MQVLSPVLARWPWFALVASAAMLGAAHAFETFGHLAPCTLCLRQREAYWIAGTIALVGCGLDLTPLRARTGRLVAALLMLAFLYGLGYAVYHAGAEQKWWPGPKECSGGLTAVKAADLDALLKGAKINIPHCDEIAWSFLGLSMAAWNGLISLGLAVASGLATFRKATPA
ncbi:MAG TPA: disulfide bond formation protein B [Caulobacteraceae bacterium]|nr:disulfide bond formation protein B [Caulobacteraceae bacterium]